MFVLVIIPPPQLKVTPVVVEVAVRVTLVMAQVSVAGAAILTLGGVMLCDTVAEAVLVQPLAGFVTVTV